MEEEEKGRGKRGRGRRERGRRSRRSRRSRRRNVAAGKVCANHLSQGVHKHVPSSQQGDTGNEEGGGRGTTSPRVCTARPAHTETLCMVMQPQDCKWPLSKLGDGGCCYPVRAQDQHLWELDQQSGSKTGAPGALLSSYTERSRRPTTPATRTDGIRGWTQRGIRVSTSVSSILEVTFLQMPTWSGFQYSCVPPKIPTTCYFAGTVPAIRAHLFCIQAQNEHVYVHTHMLLYKHFCYSKNYREKKVRYHQAHSCAAVLQPPLLLP